MAILTPAGQVIEANAALQMLLGAGANSLTGRPFREAAGLSPASAHEIPAAGSPPMATEHQFRRADGTPGWARVSVSAAPAGSDSQGVVIASLEDITSVKSAREQLRQLSLAVEQSPATVLVTDSAGNIEYSNPKFSKITGYSRAEVTARKDLDSQVQQAQRMEVIGQLVGGVAHQFNNLLTIIIGFGQLILRRLEPRGPAHKEMQEILKAAERATKLTEQLLTFGRRKPSAPLALEPSVLLTELVAPLRRIIGADIGVVTDFQSSGCVRIDPAQFEQVILNLAAGARDAMPRGGTLTISTNDEALDEAAAVPIGLEPGPHVAIIIRDTGNGIPAEDLPRIFDPVFDATPDSSGTGLGLSVAYGIVRQNSGLMTVESEPGNGSTFRILLPACEAAPEATVSPTKPVSEPSGTETVLLVEDEGGVRNMVKRILERHGYRVLEASDGASAMKLVTASLEPIQLLLTDVVMPRMSGPKLAEAVTAMRTGIKTVFMSGYPDDEKLRQAVAGAEIAFLHKPFTQSELLGKVREALDPVPRLVLVADDEPGVRMTIRHMLESSGYSVLEAADGNEAIAVLAREPVDLLITDLVMPEKEGLEVIRTVRSTRPGVKVIAISGAFGGEFLRAAELLGAHASLRKPVTLEALRKTVAGLLEANPRA